MAVVLFCCWLVGSVMGAWLGASWFDYPIDMPDSNNLSRDILALFFLGLLQTAGTLIYLLVGLFLGGGLGLLLGLLYQTYRQKPHIALD